MSTLMERLAIALAKKRGGSQAGLARACSISTASVNNWFSGKTVTMKASTLLPASRYLNVRPEWLESGNGPMTEPLATVIEVRESAPAGPPWPFAQMTPEEWGRLTAQQRGQVEGFAVGLLSAVTPPQLDGNQAA